MNPPPSARAPVQPATASAPSATWPSAPILSTRCAELRYRCVLVHSTALEARALARQKRLLDEARQALNKALAQQPTFDTAEEAGAGASAPLTKLHLRYHAPHLATVPIEPESDPRADRSGTVPHMRSCLGPREGHTLRLGSGNCSPGR